jgi:hypothetical protein
MMQRLGCKVESAENGAVALEMLLAVPDDAAPVRPGMDPRASNDEKNFDVTFLDNQVCCYILRRKQVSVD